jgi:hypothetical protein
MHCGHYEECVAAVLPAFGSNRWQFSAETVLVSSSGTTVYALWGTIRDE